MVVWPLGVKDPTSDLYGMFFISAKSSLICEKFALVIMRPGSIGVEASVQVSILYLKIEV